MLMSDDDKITEKENESVNETETVDDGEVKITPSGSIFNDNEVNESTLPLPTDEAARLNELLIDMSQKLDNKEKTVSASYERWAASIFAASKTLMQGNIFSDTVTKGDWQHGINGPNDKRINAGRPAIGNGDQKLTGKQAVMQVNHLMGLGSVIHVPLWHSGIWLYMKAPTEASLLSLERRIAHEKIDAGRKSYGLAFGNDSSYIKKYVVEFILEHVYDSNVPINELSELILSTDYPLMLWGMLTTIYPKGYPISQPCTVNREECDHVTNNNVNISKLLWTDNSAITDYMSNFMSQRKTKRTKEQILEYQEKTGHTKLGNFKITDHVSINISVPDLNTYVTEGALWIESISKMIENSFAKDLKGSQRNEYITQHTRATNLRKYVHWIESIEVDPLDEMSEVKVYDDGDTIRELCDSWSGNDTIRTAIFEAIGKAIDKSTFSLIAIPNYECPNCGNLQKDTHSVYNRLIPLDIEQIFFILIRTQTRRTQLTMG